MSNILDRGQAWLADQITQYASRDVIYRHLGQEISVRAAIGRTAFEQVDDSGAIIRFESRDFLIDQSSLQIDGASFQPAEGDTILDAIGGITFEYEILAASSSPMYRKSDPFGYKLRIHTKKVKVLE